MALGMLVTPAEDPSAKKALYPSRQARPVRSNKRATLPTPASCFRICLLCWLLCSVDMAFEMRFDIRQSVIDDKDLGQMSYKCRKVLLFFQMLKAMCCIKNSDLTYLGLLFLIFYYCPGSALPFRSPVLMAMKSMVLLLGVRSKLVKEGRSKGLVGSGKM